MAEKKTVLIVEDEANLLKIYQASLKEEFNLLIAQDGSVALELMESQPAVNLILLDLELPGTSGLEVMRHLKKHQTWNQVPVVAMSNMSNPEITEYTLGLGAKEFVVKSDFDLLKLAELIHKYAL